MGVQLKSEYTIPKSVAKRLSLYVEEAGKKIQNDIAEKYDKAVSEFYAKETLEFIKNTTKLSKSGHISPAAKYARYHEKTKK